MTEVKVFLTESETKEFACEGKPLDFNEYWGDEIQTLLSMLSYIVTQPGFDERQWREYKEALGT